MKFKAKIARKQYPTDLSFVIGNEYTLEQILIEYVNQMAHSWSIKTQISEVSRLRGSLDIIKEIGSFKPLEIMNKFIEKGNSKYSVKTRMIRLKSFYQFLMDAGFVSGPNVFDNLFIIKSRFFRNAYVKEDGLPTIEEVMTKILTIENPRIKEHINFLLLSGLRIDESYKVIEKEKDQFYVEGKGGRYRRVYATPPRVLVHKSLIYQELRPLGIKPHTLRKLCATRLVKRGATSADLMKVMGWNKIETAGYYLQAQQDEKIKEMMSHE